MTQSEVLMTSRLCFDHDHRIALVDQTVDDLEHLRMSPKCRPVGSSDVDRPPGGACSSAAASLTASDSVGRAGSNRTYPSPTSTRVFPGKRWMPLIGSKNSAASRPTCRGPRRWSCLFVVHFQGLRGCTGHPGTPRTAQTSGRKFISILMVLSPEHASQRLPLTLNENRPVDSLRHLRLRGRREQRPDLVEDPV